MAINRVKILKQNRVRLGGTQAIPIGGSSVPSMSKKPVEDLHAGPAQARVLESNSDYAIIEILCSCGQKSHIQCNYGNVTTT